MRVRDLNWFQLEEYLRGDDRIVLPIGSTEQHAHLSLETDNILAERASLEAAEPLGIPVLPVIAYGVTVGFLGLFHFFALGLLLAHGAWLLFMRRDLLLRWGIAAVLGSLPAIPVVWYGMGQRDAVTAWYLLAAETIDETMARLIASKRGTVAAVTDGRAHEGAGLVEAVITVLRGG